MLFPACRRKSSDPNADMWFNTGAFVTPPPVHLRNGHPQQRVGTRPEKADLALDREIPLAVR